MITTRHLFMPHLWAEERREIARIAMQSDNRRGYGIFVCSGSAYGPLQIQRFDSPGEGEDDIWWGDIPDNEFTDDAQCWELVVGRAIAGDLESRCILTLLRDENPIHLFEILEHEGLRHIAETVGA